MRAKSARRHWAPVPLGLIGTMLALALALCGVPLGRGGRVEGAPVDGAAIDAHVERQMDRHALPGVAVAIVEGDRIVHVSGYGLAGRDRPMTPQTPLYIGSVSKSFTALVVMQLVEEGALDLDTPVRDILPWFAVADPEASAAITVRHLLHHASGLSDADFDRVLPANITREEAVRALRIARQTSPVGAASHYFNLNYATLSLIAETVAGRPFETLVQERIYDPLEMTHSHTAPDTARADGLADGYSRWMGVTVPRKQVYRGAELGAGYLMCSVEDMAHYAIAYLNGGRYHGASVLSPAGIAEMFRPGDQEGFAYGMGWFVGQDEGLVRIEHGGSLEAFKAEVVLYPERDLGIVVLYNQGHMLDAFVSRPQLTEGIVDLVLGREAPRPGLSTKVLAAILVLAFAATLFSALRGLAGLRGWRARAAAMSRARRIWDVAAHFVMPTAIDAIILWQVARLFGDRFNLATIAPSMALAAPDMLAWLLIGTLPDYVQGVCKLVISRRGNGRG